MGQESVALLAYQASLFVTEWLEIFGQMLFSSRTEFILNFAFASRLIGIFAVKTFDHEVVKLIELDKGQDQAEKYHEALVKTPDIADPVQNTVHIPINPVQIKVELPRHLHVHIVRELVRPILLMLVAKYPPIIFRQLAKLIVCVLQPQIRQLNLVNDLFTHLRIHRYVLEL